MSESKELKKIKQIYGEKFARMCRDMFPVIIEQEGTLLNILEKRFSHNCNSLYEAITENGLEADFKELIFSEFDEKREEVEEETRTPYEILEEKGYDLIECKTEEDIQSFRKYYAPDEVLCTIYNGGRLATRDCFFAVRKDVDKIHREDFTSPKKTDEYSLSVLGIQFTRDRKSTVQIISRYNHTVPNPNCTLENDLDRLAPGLNQSFTNLLNERGMNLEKIDEEAFELPGYTLANDGRYYKYNMEIDGNYYCPGNIVIRYGKAQTLCEPEKGILADYFFVNLESKTIECEGWDWDAFTDAFKDIRKIEVEKTAEKGKIIKAYMPDSKVPAIIKIDKDNQIIGYENESISIVGDWFLEYNEELRELSLPKLQQVGNCFLGGNGGLMELSLPKLQQVGDGFLECNKGLMELSLPKLQQVGDWFLKYNKELKELSLPKLQQVGDGFLGCNKGLMELSLPKLQQVGDGFLECNKGLMELSLPKLQQVGDRFLKYNRGLKELSLPKLQKVGDGFLYRNQNLRKLSLPELQQARDCFLHDNRELRELSLPELKQVGDMFLYENQDLRELSLPKLEQVGENFLCANIELRELSMPELQQVGDWFLGENEELKKLSLPKLEQVGENFLFYNQELRELSLPKLEQVGYEFLAGNPELRDLVLQSLAKKDNLIKKISLKMETKQEQQHQLDTLRQGRDKQNIEKQYQH